MKKLLFKIALWFLTKRIVNSNEILTSEYLESIGWISPDPTGVAGEKRYWVEPNVKDRDKVWINFENHYYRVWHGRDKTFIALESSLEWFKAYMLLLDPRKTFVG